MEKKIITEEMKIQNEWYEKAPKMTLEELPSFLKGLMENYKHDYGTICHALASGAIATMWAMNNNEQGGITGFQASCILWEVIRNWSYKSNTTGLKLVDYDNFLYPQYEDKFDKTISKDTWEAIQKQAKEKIEEADKEYNQYLIKKEQYEIDIAKFIEKYPDFYENKEHYERLCCGTGAEWDEYHKKEKEGFEFAPSEPYEPLNEESPVYRHWKAIINGVVPFGYRVTERE